MLKPFVQAVGRSLIWFKNHPCQPAGEGLDEFPASVGRAWVDYDVFNRRVILPQHGVERFLQILALIEGDGDDAELHRQFAIIGIKRFAITAVS